MTLLQIIHKIDIQIYSFTCISKKKYDIKNIEEVLIDSCKNNIKGIRYKNNHLVFNFPNKIDNSKYREIEVYINIFSKNLKYDVCFTSTNLKLNINTGILSMINVLTEFKQEYLSKIDKNIVNNKCLYNICVNDLLNNNPQFLLSHKLDYFVKNKFSNKYQFKNRIDYYINDVFNFISDNKKNNLLNIIDNYFKKTNNMSLKYLIFEPKNINIDDCCLICLEKLNSEDCFKLPCCNKFMHKNCVIECEKYDHKCPNCRKDWYE